MLISFSIFECFSARQRISFVGVKTDCFTKWASFDLNPTEIKTVKLYLFRQAWLTSLIFCFYWLLIFDFLFDFELPDYCMLKRLRISASSNIPMKNAPFRFTKLGKFWCEYYHWPFYHCVFVPTSYTSESLTDCGISGRIQFGAGYVDRSYCWYCVNLEGIYGAYYLSLVIFLSTRVKNAECNKENRKNVSLTVLQRFIMTGEKTNLCTYRSLSRHIKGCGTCANYSLFHVVKMRTWNACNLAKYNTMLHSARL